LGLGAPRPIIIGFCGSVRTNKLGFLQKDSTTRYPSGTSTARQQGPTLLGHTWQKDPTCGYPYEPNAARQHEPTSLGYS